MPTPLIEPLTLGEPTSFYALAWRCARGLNSLHHIADSGSPFEPLEVDPERASAALTDVRLAEASLAEAQAELAAARARTPEDWIAYEQDQNARVRARFEAAARKEHEVGDRIRPMIEHVRHFEIPESVVSHLDARVGYEVMNALKSVRAQLVSCLQQDLTQDGDAYPTDPRDYNLDDEEIDPVQLGKEEIEVLQQMVEGRTERLDNAKRRAIIAAETVKALATLLEPFRANPASGPADIPGAKAVLDTHGNELSANGGSEVEERKERLREEAAPRSALLEALRLLQPTSPETNYGEHGDTISSHHYSDAGDSAWDLVLHAYSEGWPVVLPDKFRTSAYELERADLQDFNCTVELCSPERYNDPPTLFIVPAPNP